MKSIFLSISIFWASIMSPAIAADHPEELLGAQCWLPTRADSRDFVYDAGNVAAKFLFTDKDVKDVRQLFYIETANGVKKVIRVYTLRGDLDIICQMTLK